MCTFGLKLGRIDFDRINLEQMNAIEMCTKINLNHIFMLERIFQWKMWELIF